MPDIYANDLPVDDNPDSTARALLVDASGTLLIQGPTEYNRAQQFATADQGMLAEGALQDAALFATAAQGIVKVASAAARDTYFAGVLAEGMTCYLSDTNLLTTYDGAAWSVIGATAPTYDMQTFTSSGTFTIASYPWARVVKIRVVGGGGGGGGCEATSGTEVSGGGGGGGGGYVESRIPVSALSASETVTVGGGGAGGVGYATGAAGNSSSFGSHGTGNGGGGGGGGLGAVPNIAAGYPGGGGSASFGGINISGDPGTFFTTIFNAIGRVQGSSGGASRMGAGGGQNYSASGFNGAAGRNYGGGGSGAAADNNVAALNGGAGAQGIVIVEMYG